MRKNIYGIMAAVCLSSVLAAGCGGKNQAETLPAQSSETMSVQVSETVAATEETAEQQSVGTEGMTPVLASELRDGVYQIQVDSSSSMFRIEACELTVKDGSMTADMKMGGTGYLKLYMGTGEEAAKAPPVLLSICQKNTDTPDVSLIVPFRPFYILLSYVFNNRLRSLPA